MANEVKLYQKETSYKDKQTGEEKKATHFYLMCGSKLIPISLVYFENKETKNDPQYASRKAVLQAFAEPLPEKDVK